MIRMMMLMAVGLVALAAADRPTQHLPVFNEHLEVHWLADGTHAWYRRQTAVRQHEFMLIDAVAGTRALAFDHAAMAAGLSERLQRPVEPAALPIGALELVDDGRTLLIGVNGGTWFETPRTRLALTPSVRGPRPMIGRTPRPTRETGEATTLTVSNRASSVISLVWSDFDGARKWYAHIEPGAEVRQNTFAGHVWMALDRTGTVLGVVEAGADGQRIEIDGVAGPPEPVPADPNQSPDGRWQAFIAGDNLWLRSRRDGQTFALSSDGNPSDAFRLPVQWSPDSRHVVGWRVAAGERRTIKLIESSPTDQVQPRLRTIRYDKPGDRIDEVQPMLFSTDDRRSVAVDRSLLVNPWLIDELAWAADSSGFTMRFNQRGHQLMRVVEVRCDGSVRSVIEERSATFIDYAGKGFFQRVDHGRSILWMSERDGWNHLYRYDTASGQVKNQVTSGSWVVRAVDRVDEEAGLIWFTAGGLVAGEDPYQLHLARVAFDGSGLTRLTDGDGNHSVAWSPDRRWLVDTWSRVDAAPQHVLRDGRTGRLVVALEQADASLLRASGWQQPERFVAKGRDGVTDIHGVLWRPRGFDQATRYPVVECIYAGPQSAYVPKAFHSGSGQQTIADLGFVVGMIDGMGTSQRSKAFHDVCWKNLADAGFPDRIPWWRAAAANRPWLDLSRVGIYGGSAGGQNALGALLFHPEFYHVAVADCGCHDNRMDKLWWNELWMGWPLGPHYAEQSNVTNAARLQGKLMLIVGELDDNVDPQSTFQVAHALEQAGKDFELVVVHGAGHGAAETPFGSQKRAGFLVRHLLGREP